MGNRNLDNRDKVWEDILSADFDLGWEVWNQYLNNHHQSLNHKLDPNLIKDMKQKFNNQSIERRERLMKLTIKKDSWIAPDIRVQDEAEAIDYLRRIQGFDVVLGKPLTLNEWSQDR